MTPATRAFAPFIALLFAGTLSNSAIVPFMVYFLVDTLDQPPWMLSVYTGLATCCTIALNRAFAVRIDRGARVFPLIGIAGSGFVVACAAMALFPSLATMLTVAVLGYGLSASAMSTMFSLGNHMTKRHNADRSRVNAVMRATASAAWMIGPACSFLIAGRFGSVAVFQWAFVLGLCWLAMWWFTLPRDVEAKAPAPAIGAAALPTSAGLGLAAAFLFCLSIAHGLTFYALPLFFVREVGLPAYAPGAAYTVKTFVEIIAIFSSPFLIARFGLRNSLLAATLLAIVAIQALAAVQTMPQMVIGMALEGLYYGLFASLGISYVQSLTEDRPAQGTAIYWNTMMLSSLMAGPAVGLIAQARDFHAVFMVATVVAAVAVAVLIVGIRAHRQAQA